MDGSGPRGPEPGVPRPLGGRHRPGPDAFRRLGPEFAGLTVTGIGFDRDVLIEAGIERADAFAAVSSGDNSNIISARVARETFSVRRVVARIYDQRRAEVYERLGIPTVATVRWTADRMVRQLVREGHVELWRDPTGTVSIVEVPLHDGWVRSRVRPLEEASGARAAYIMRFGIGTLTTRLDGAAGRRPGLHAADRRHGGRGHQGHRRRAGDRTEGGWARCGSPSGARATSVARSPRN